MPFQLDNLLCFVFKIFYRVDLSEDILLGHYLHVSFTKYHHALSDRNVADPNYCALPTEADCHWQ